MSSAFTLQVGIKTINTTLLYLCGITLSIPHQFTIHSLDMDIGR